MSKAPISARPQVFYIRPAPGWLEMLFEEVNSIVQKPLQKYKYDPKITLLKGTVKLHRCDWRQGLEVMLRLTTAHDVEWMILESKCNQWTEVDAILSRVPWDDIIRDKSIPIHVSSDVYQGFTNHSAKLRENLCKISGLTHVSEGGIYRFKIELRSDFLRVSVSLCGEPLYKRGYKALLSATAPLPEHQAAACIRWVLAQKNPEDRVSQVWVPFAGTGTFGFESQVVFSGAGPGAFVRSFTCESFPCVSEATFRFYRKKLKEQMKDSLCPEVIFNEINLEACSVLKQNIQAFLESSPSSKTSLLEGDFFETQFKLPENGKVVMLLNPPFGDRLAKSSSVPELYAKLGKHIREKYRNQQRQILGGCLCPDEKSWRSFLKQLSPDSTETHHFTHGGKEMRLVRWC